VYKPNPKDFSDLDEGDVQEEGLNTISLNESENEVNKEYNKSNIIGRGRSFNKIFSGIS
jgi:hypothetical protein